LPEFFCGFDRSDIATPVPFPTSCSPQAWAAATPLLLMRMMLGLEPNGDGGLVIDPIAGAIDMLALTGVRCGSATFDIRVADTSGTISAR
jgi:glycogen debranching enzyme